MRILHAIDSFNFGGIQDLIFFMHKYDRFNTHDGWGAPGSITPEMTAAGFVTWAGGPPQEAEYDVFVGHGVGGWSYDNSFRWAKERGMKTVEVMHSIARSQTDPKLTDAFVGVSRLAFEANPQFAIRSVIPPIVDDSLFEIEVNPQKQGYIGKFSRVVEEKRPHWFSQLSRHYPNEKFVLAGDGPYMAETKRLAGQNLEFAGMLRPNRWAEFYRNCKLFVFPTKDECNSVAVAMAQAAGVPVFCQDIPALRDSTGGYATFCKDLTDFAGWIREFLYSDWQGWDHVHDAKQWAIDNYSAEEVLGLWDYLFEGIGL